MMYTHTNTMYVYVFTIHLCYDNIKLFDKGKNKCINKAVQRNIFFIKKKKKKKEKKKMFHDLSFDNLLNHLMSEWQLIGGA